MTGFIKNW